MFARVITSQPRPDLVDSTVNNFREQVVSTARKQKGFKGTLLLVDRKLGRTVGITLWENEADMKASENGADHVGTQPVKDVGFSSPSIIEHYEIADQA